MTQTQLLQVTRSIFVNTNIALGTHDVKIKPHGKTLMQNSYFMALQLHEHQQNTDRRCDHIICIYI